jgi:hypothetical protein
MLSVRIMLPWIALVLCTLYAIMRYIVFQGVSLENLPVYVLNKAVSFAGLILLALSRCHHDRALRKEWGTAGLILIALHVLLSLPILQPAYFSGFFHQSGKMNWQGETSLLAGALASFLLWYLFAASQKRNGTQMTENHSLAPFAGRALLILAALHVALMGYAGWFEVQMWPGYMPPITLLACATAVTAALWPRY